MRNEAVERLHPLVGEWVLTLSDAWFLEPRDTVLTGRATVRWLGDSFVEMVAELDGIPAWHLVMGHSDAQDRYVLLYGDERGVGRVFDMEYDGRHWSWSRADPDFFQRFVGELVDGRIEGRCDASEDAGATWRKDFDLVFSRASSE